MPVESTTQLSAPSPPSSTDVMIDVRHVYKQYDNGPMVLKDINFQVHADETLAIIGTSGCGKSTLLKVLAGLEDASSGEVDLRDPNYTLVFQYSALFDHLTVFENVAFALTERPDTPSARRAFRPLPFHEVANRVNAVLDLLGLAGMGDKYPNELSGGMQKRVSFARATMTNPRIIFYDEPTSGLDPVASNVVEDAMVTLSHNFRTASVVVSHTMSTICRTAHRVLMLYQGEVHWVGTPAEMLVTDNPQVKAFVKAAFDLPVALPASLRSTL
jgi:phospholipid/cholesterol/gamma-HCH transport system ATP-binding protein